MLTPYLSGIELSEFPASLLRMTRRILAVIFACPGCGKLFVATQKRSAKPSSGQFNCLDCATTIHRWSAEYNYASWRRQRSALATDAISIRQSRVRHLAIVSEDHHRHHLAGCISKMQKMAPLKGPLKSVLIVHIVNLNNPTSVRFKHDSPTVHDVVMVSFNSVPAWQFARSMRAIPKALSGR